MMLKEAMAYLVSVAERAANKPIDIGQRKFWSSTGQEILPRRSDMVATVPTLDGLLSVLDSYEMVRYEVGVDVGEMEDGTPLLSQRYIAQIVVESPTLISVSTPPDPITAYREMVIQANCNVTQFPFGRYMELEDFIIKVQCMFSNSPIKNQLIAHVSSICDEQIVTNTDDGISQSVVRKDSVGRKERAEMSPMLVLHPMRTFPEIDQPASMFLLRIQKGPTAALFEADGGQWEADACKAIAAYLRADERVKAMKIPVIG